LGVESLYGALCRSFNKLAFQEDDPELTLSLQEEGMIEVRSISDLFFLQIKASSHFQYFESYACEDDNSERTAGFESHAIYRGEFLSSLFYLLPLSLGYIDDVRNTDNAWVEGEIWNFHYGLNMSFPRLRNDVCFNISSLSCELSRDYLFDCRVWFRGKI
jgi:hypothetical protein